MVDQVEIASLDLRYEGFRMKIASTEKALLMSIMEKGIRAPLQGVDTKDTRILLDGFKRLRCAKKLGIGVAPYVCMGVDEVLGIIELIRMSNAKSLSILEQARFVDELKSVHNMSSAEIAGLLERSKSWVSMRSGIMGEMSQYVMQKIFNGEFPVYSFMYTLRQFIRMNRIDKSEIDSFVKCVAGKKLSIRDIDYLANGYFKGSADFREQINSGNLLWGLKRLKQASKIADGCNERERAMLKSLEITLRYIQRLTAQCNDAGSKSNAFYAQANLLSGGIIRQMDTFSIAIRAFHDRTGQA